MTVVTDEGLGTIDSAPAPAASIAAPGAIPYHGVTDHELERFAGFQPPIPIAVAGVFAGVFLATMVGAVGSALAFGGGGTGLGDVLLVVVNALSLGVAATSAVFAFRAKAEITTTLAAIRRRARITIAPEIDGPNSS